MPAPSTFSRRVGRPVMWSRQQGGVYHPAGDYLPDGRWSIDEVTIGSRETKGGAKIRFNRRTLIDGAAEPIMYQDALFAIGYLEVGLTNATIIFEGSPAIVNRNIRGGPHGEADTGDARLQSAEILWAGHADSQVVGVYAAKIPDPTTTTNAKLVMDTSLPCCFNPKGKPNRSVYNDKKTGMFPTAEQTETHYFAPAGGMDIFKDGSTVISQGARYWTYAQAIAYLLARHAGATADAAIPRNYVDLYFGTPPKSTPADLDDDASTIWGACIGDNRVWPNRTCDKEAYGVVYDGEELEPDPLPFTPLASMLLTAKVPALDVTGKNVLDAIGTLLHAAGLGWWYDVYLVVSMVPPGADGVTYEAKPVDPRMLNYQPTVDGVDGLTDSPTHTLRVWTAGGELNGDEGIGKKFAAMLQPHGTSIYSSGTTLRLPEDIIEKNTLQTVDCNWDYAHINNAPMLLRGPTLYEVTIQLRPGWKPLHDAALGYFDNVNPATMIETSPGPPAVNDTELNVAMSDAMLAFYPWVANFDTAVGTAPTGALLRAVNMSQRLHAKGKYGDKFYDIGRKWIIPTDWSYPNASFARSAIGTVPTHWQSYLPVNFNDLSAEPFISTPIPGAEAWPVRARPLLPCLVADASGRSIGIVVELSWEEGAEGTWHPWSAFRVLRDECGIMLTYESPYDVVCPKRFDGEVAAMLSGWNLFLSMLHHTFRVRVTATIEGSDDATFSGLPGGFQSDMAPRTKVTVRRDRYSKRTVLSKHKDNWTRHPKNLEIPAEVTSTSKVFIFRPQDDTATMDAEVNRIRAMTGAERMSGTFGIPWIELNAMPGCVVEEVNESEPPATGCVARNLRFQQDIGNDIKLAPCIAGVTYTFATEAMTLIHVDDWRAPLSGAFA